MTLPPGTRIGAYEIVSSLGAGGMGEVYRAKDTRLGREVAIKVLPGSLAHDSERLARFEREARTLGSLNHPNIAQVYGLEDGAGGADGRGPCLVMELLDGHSLADVLVSGALPVRKVTEYAGQIARGLAAAHDRGVIHRDLKPDNIFVLPDGRVKILDFGLARQVEPAAAADAGTLVTRARHTDPGTVMGTVGYMAPEQIRAEPTDARSDLFSLGVVLYEMLAGTRAFRRETTAETMTAILREDPPDLTTLRSDISPALLRIVHRCLEKSPSARFQTGADLAFALETLSGVSHGSGAASGIASAAPGTPAGRGDQAPRVNRGFRRLGWVAGGLAITAAAVLVGRLAPAESAAPAAPAPVVRGSIVLPEGVRMTDLLIPARRMAMSPDGRYVVFVGGARGEAMPPDRLWLLTLANGTARELEGTVGGNTPFWSPDSRTVGFSDQAAGLLKRVNIDGGTPIRLTSLPASAAWRPDDSIVALGLPPNSKALVVPANGGEVRDLLSVPPGRIVGFPAQLPGTEALLYGVSSPASASAATPTPGDPSARHLSLMVHPAQGPERVLFDSADPLNVAYANGHLLYVMGSTLFARPFDPLTQAFTGVEVPLADDVTAALANGAAFAVSQVGTLAYAPQPFQRNSRLVWLDRSGRPLRALGVEADYTNVSLSPDDTRLAVSVTDPAKNTHDVYVMDIARGTRQRLTFDVGDERSSAWSADGRRVFYARDRNLYSRSADFTGPETPVQTDDASKDPRQASRDGKSLVFRRSGQGNDIWVLSLDGDDHTGHPILESRFNENYAGLSPDARSLVYASNESGRDEVYVVSLEGGGGKALLSTAGGSFPTWRRDGREVVYLAPDKTLMSVMVKGSGASFQASAPTPLFKIDPQPGPGVPYDLTADGQHFVINAIIPSRIPPSLSVIVNWPSLATQHAPAQ